MGLKVAKRMGNITKFAIRAVTMASAVKMPKYMVGTKFENTMIKKPAVITMVV